MGDVFRFQSHQALASAEALNPKRVGSASFPLARSASEKTKKCSVGIRPRNFQLDGAFVDLMPANEQAAEAPPTASITSSMVDKILVTHRDNSRSVSMSTPHGFGLVNLCESGVTLAAMYSKSQAAKRLIQTQEALELSNAEISQKLGVASNGWSMYRTGDRTIPHKVLVGLKEQFGVTADWILAGDPSGLPQRLYARLRIAA